MSDFANKDMNADENTAGQPLVNEQSPMDLQQIPQIEQQTYHRELNLLYPQFEDQYKSSLSSLNLVTQEKIQKWTWNREKQNYLYFIQPKKFVQFTQKQRLQHFQEHNSQLVTRYLLEALRKRQHKIERLILQDEIVIYPNKQPKKTISKQNQTQSLIHQSSILTPQQQKAYQQQLQKRHQQILLQHKKQRLRLQKLKQQQLQQKQQSELAQLTQQQKQKEDMKRHHSELITKKIAQQKERREKLSKQHEERKKDYEFVVKSWASSVLLHQKMEKQFRSRYEKMFDEERKRIQSQRQRLSLNARVEELNIKEHEQKYLTKRSQRQAVRAAKLQEQQRIVETYQRQLKKYKKYRRPNQNGSDQDEDDKNSSQNSQNSSRYNTLNKKDKTYHELQKEKRDRAMQRRKKMQQYWETFVKQQKQPKIDPKKQKEIQDIIQSLENARKMRKVKNQKGQIVYEELKLCDPTMKGMEYLEHARQLGRMRKSMKRKDTDDQSSVDESSQVKKSIDYLKQLRQSRSSSLNSSSNFIKNQKLSFLDKKDLTFHQKLQRVDRETFKLQQMTKNSQNQLKYGKFKTSEEILQYKEDIDNNHVEILKMKIRLAAGGAKAI